MEIKMVTKLNTLVAIGILLIIALGVTFIPAYLWMVPDEYNHSIFAYFLGINQTIVVAGTFFLSFFLLRQLRRCIDHNQIIEEKKLENAHKLAWNNQLISDAKSRRESEQKSNQINDYFKLIELAKEKTKELHDNGKAKTKDPDNKHIDDNGITKKTESVNPEKLSGLIKHYEILISEQQNKKE
ncbi:MAG: hypothetical protein V1775_00150 [Bacteroidota bacterium]